MYIYRHQNAAGSKITVTATATNIFDLINTAAGTNLPNAGFPSKDSNAINIVAENGDIRYLMDGNTPTAVNGILVKSGERIMLRNIPLKNLQLIRVTLDVTCSVEIGRSDVGEASSSSVTTGGSGGGGGTVAISQTGTDNDVDVISVTPGTAATNLGKAEDAVHTSGDVGVMSLGVRKDTAVSLAGTDGDYTAPIFGASGHQHMAEGFTAQAEDNTRGVIKVVNTPLADGTYAWTSDSSSALEASSIVKASAGTLRLFSGNIDSSAATATYYLQFFNSASVPADATAVAANFIAPTVIKHTNGTPSPINLDFTDNCKAFTTGLVWCLSTTQYTKTITGAVVNATVLYK